jgi:ankyrin repeat protein
LDEEIARIQALLDSLENIQKLAQLHKQRVAILNGTKHAKNSLEHQALQLKLQEEAALDGLDKLLLHSEIQAIVDNLDLQDLMDPSGSCVLHLCMLYRNPNLKFHHWCKYLYIVNSVLLGGSFRNQSCFKFPYTPIATSYIRLVGLIRLILSNLNLKKQPEPSS